LLLSRERAKFSSARRKVRIAAVIAKAMSRTNFGLTMPPEEIAAVRSKNEFLEVPISRKQSMSHRILLSISIVAVLCNCACSKWLEISNLKIKQEPTELGGRNPPPIFLSASVKTNPTGG